jgi:D-alanyl-D-alanine carboxypeptidase/D-alanyl-D-alanine-endopeptidase (penicillin-binding protein 4)
VRRLARRPEGRIRRPVAHPLRRTVSDACGEKVWPIAYAEPASYNQRALAGCGARWAGGSAARSATAPRTGVAAELRVGPPTLPEVIRDINKFSNNVMAQQLFLTLGLAERGIGTPDTARSRSALAVRAHSATASAGA